MKIIDFKKKGNIVRFYLGEKTEDWGWTNPDFKYDGGEGLETPDWLEPQDRFYGDDWDDINYEDNAGTVYDEFVKGYKDIAFNFDDIVLEPKDQYNGSGVCKDDMVDRKVPCIIVVPKEILNKLNLDEWQVDAFDYAIRIHGIKKYYFGDELEPDNEGE